MATSIGLLLFGAVVGVASGVLGIGGGIVLVPGLVMLFGFTQPEAQGTSLAVLIPPIGIFAAMIYYQHGFVRLPVVALIAGGFMMGALVGAKLAPHVPIDWLRLAFGGLLLYLGFVFVLDLRAARPRTALPAAAATAVAVLASRLARRRWHPPAAPEPPSAGVEYHI